MIPWPLSTIGNVSLQRGVEFELCETPRSLRVGSSLLPFQMTGAINVVFIKQRNAPWVCRSLKHA
jgi:hypothetical protein